MRKKMSEITTQEAVELLWKNNDLDMKVHRYATEDAELYLDDILSGCRENYELDGTGYRRSYFEIKDAGTFWWWIKDVQQDFCLLSDEDFEAVEEYIDAHYAYEEIDVYDVDDDEIDKAEQKVEELQEKAEDIICRRLLDVYMAYDDIESRAMWFVDMMDVFFDDDMDGVFYDDEYNVKRFVPKQIVPARVIPAHTEVLF